MLWQKFVLWLLLPEQKEHRAAVANDLVPATTDEPGSLRKIITGDEAWVYGLCDPETKAQSSLWKSPGSPRLKKAR